MQGWFSLRRAGALFRIEARQLLVDRSTLLLIFGLPIMQILLYGYGVSFMPRDVSVLVSTNSSDVARPLLQAFRDDPVMRVYQGVVKPTGTAEQAVASGEVGVGLEILSSDSQQTHVHIFVNGSDPATVTPVVARLLLGVWRNAAQIYYGNQPSAEKKVPMPEVSTTWVSGSPDQETWAVAPGLVGVVVMVSMLFLGAMTLVRERERGTWESLLSTPIRPAEALIGKLAPYLVIGMIETILLLGIVHVLFAVPLPWASLALVASAPLFAGSYLILGFVFSAIAQTQLQAVQGAVGVYLPSLLLSGFLFPFSGMPVWAKWVGEALPLTHYLRASREILLGHAPPDAILSHLAPIAIFAVIASGIAVLAYRRRLD